MSALPEAVAVTFFSDYAAARSREDRLSPADLARQVREMVAAEKSRLPWLKLARFGAARTKNNSLRHDANVLSITGVEADYDGEEIGFDAAVETAGRGGLACIIYTSPSHMPDKPRWRVLCPLSRESPPEDRYRLVARLNGLYGGIFASESFTLSQSYYFGKVAGAVEHRVKVLDGEPIDLLDELDDIAIGRPNGQAPHEPEDGAAHNDLEADIFDVFAALAVIPNNGAPDWEEWNRIGLAICGATGGSEAGGIAFDTWSKKNPAYDAGLTRERWQHIVGHPPNRIGAGTLFHLAAQARPGWRKPSAEFVVPPSGDPYTDYGTRYGNPGGQHEQAKEERHDEDEGEDFNAPPPPPRPLVAINPTTLAFIPVPPRQWLVPDWIPMERVTGLYGAGGEGKTTIAQQLSTASAIGKPWLGLPVRRGRSVLLFCEDDLDEMHRRQNAINEHYGCDFGDLETVRWLPRLGADNVLMNFDRGRAFLAPIFDQLLETVQQHKADLVAVDTLADVFAGSENDRGQARLFVQQALGQIARLTGAAVVALAHPSLTGISSGSGTSGNTGWVGTFRSHLFLTTPPPDGGEEEGATEDNARILSRKKANFARRNETIELFWKEGVFAAKISSTGILGSIERKTCERVFLDLLDKTAEQEQRVSHRPRAGNYAPRIFSMRPDRERFTKADFERAMHNLLARKEIKIGTYKDGYRRDLECLIRAP